VPIYDYRCADGHRFERLVPFKLAATQRCPACGAAAAKVPSRVALGGTADPGRSQEQMPQTWRGTYGANPEYVTQLRREWGARQKLEEKHPELQGDRRPVLAHEGRFEGAPLRAGDPLPGHPHSHPHPHPH
jgi:putative FmdB family regulatory protein